MLLLLNADLPEQFPGDERRIHIFTCRRSQCSRNVGSVRALRETRKHKIEGMTEKQTPKPATPTSAFGNGGDLGAMLFGATSTRPAQRKDENTSSPFLASPLSPSGGNHLDEDLPQTPQQTENTGSRDRSMAESFANKLRINGRSPPPQEGSPASELWPPDSDVLKPFPLIHLDAEYEFLTPNPPSLSGASFSKIQNLEQEEENPRGDLDKADKDDFESSLDKTFVKFSECLAQNPEQVLRYEWNGTPLLYSRTDAVGRKLADSTSKSTTGSRSGMPRCEQCGEDRVFELQLVPGAINALEEQVDGSDSMEWGTIILGVCRQNCGRLGDVVFREEWCGVQLEETK